MKETYRDGMLSKGMYLSGLLPLKMATTVWPICHRHECCPTKVKGLKYQIWQIQVILEMDYTNTALFVS